MYIVIHEMQLDQSFSINAKRKIDSNSNTIQSLKRIGYLEKRKVIISFSFQVFVIHTLTH